VIFIYRYLVTRDDGKETQYGSCISAIHLVEYHSIIASGFDPYDPFAQFSVTIEDFPDEAFAYGLSISEVVYDIEMINEMYRQRFIKPTKEIEDTA